MLIFVCDVESVGLRGEGFAAGWCVYDRHILQEKGICVCHPDAAQGNQKDRDWVNENVVPAIASELKTKVAIPAQVRTRFWEAWTKWRGKGAVFVADCPYPVELRFLEDCIKDDSDREWYAPYPLIDVGTIILGKGKDPLANFDRLPEELPKHNPLADALQSARLFLENYEQRN